jgi:excisionase family DNA binding protein
VPRTKKKPEPAAQPAPPPQAVNGPAGEVMTLAEAAAYLRLPETDVLRLVHEQALPARRLANEWRFLKEAIREWLSKPPPKPNKERWMELAGVWKDDPYVEDELKEIYKRRGRPTTEDES